jgi:hypothetical protein
MGLNFGAFNAPRIGIRATLETMRHRDIALGFGAASKEGKACVARSVDITTRR